MAWDKGTAGAALLAASLGFGWMPVACQGGSAAGQDPEGDDSAAIAEGRLIGKWILRKYHSEGYLKVGSITFPLDADTLFTDDACYLDLKADRRFVSDFPDAENGTKVEVGTWSFSGGTLTTIGSEDGVGEPDTVRWGVSISGRDAEFSSRTEEKDSLSEFREVILINAVKQ